MLARFLLVLIGVAALIAGPAAAETKVLRVVPHADLTQLDPVFASIVITREYGLMIYEELFAWDFKLQPRPQMVESWTVSPDELTWRFTLRDSLKFHDGQPVTTADVVPSLKRWMSRDLVGAKVLAVLASIDLVDAEDVRAETEEAVSEHAVLPRFRHRADPRHHARERSGRRSDQASHHFRRLRPIPLQQGGEGQWRAYRVRSQSRLCAALGTPRTG